MIGENMQKMAMQNAESKPVVLVTAVGAPPGLNTLRALLEYDRFDVVAADADKYSPALYGFEVPHVILNRATDEEVFIGTLKQVIREKNIKVIISCIETEIFAIARHPQELEALGVDLLIPDKDILVNASPTLWQRPPRWKRWPLVQPPANRLNTSTVGRVIRQPAPRETMAWASLIFTSRVND